MGAHVWGPAYLRDHLLPHWPAHRLDARLVRRLPRVPVLHAAPGAADRAARRRAALRHRDEARHGARASSAMPVCAYVMGRLFRLPFPGPPLLAVATLPFLFDRTWTIYGGNIPSTLAGEYSFSISLSLALLFFGVLARGARDGPTPRPGHRAARAGRSSATPSPRSSPCVGGARARAPALGLAPASLLRGADPRRRRAAHRVLVDPVRAAPRLPHRHGLGEARGATAAALLPEDTRWVLVLALVGLVLVARRSGSASGAFFGVARQRSSPSGFRVRRRSASSTSGTPASCPSTTCPCTCWRPSGVSEVLRSLAVIVDAPDRVATARWRRASAPSASWPRGDRARRPAAAASCPGGSTTTRGRRHVPRGCSSRRTTTASWTAGPSGTTRATSARPATPSTAASSSTMQEVGDEHGCGRAHWEYESDLNRYGTPMAMMLLPFWTDGCIGSMEGLYFESSGTTPFHFLNAAETSVAPSNPVRDLPERPMQYSPASTSTRASRTCRCWASEVLHGVLAQAIAAADRHPDLTEVAESPPWKVYEVAGSELVEPLANEPAVLEGMSDDQPRVAARRGGLVHRSLGARRRSSRPTARRSGSASSEARSPSAAPLPEDEGQRTSTRTTCRSASTSTASASRSS